VSRRVSMLLALLLLLGVAVPTALAADDQVYIGTTTITLRHAFFQAIDAGIRDAAARIGARVETFDPDLSLERQVAAMEDFIQKGVDGIVLIAVDNRALAPVIEEAVARGIPVVTVDAPVFTDAVTTFVGTPNYEAGVMLGRYVRDYIEKELGGRAKVAVIQWLESQVQIDRTEGLLSVIEDMPGVQLVGVYPGYDRDQSFATTMDLLTAHPDLDIIYAPAENAVVGAHAALETARRLDVKIFGFDMTEEAVLGIRDGSIVAMAQQQPYLLGQIAVQSLMIALYGNELLGSDWLPPERSVPVVIYTKDNIGQYEPDPTSPRLYR